tara:strand:- start:636 stop:884 length:249 start_codon:yes stop_codon:yes gene_type:complete
MIVRILRTIPITGGGVPVSVLKHMQESEMTTIYQRESLDTTTPRVSTPNARMAVKQATHVEVMATLRTTRTISGEKIQTVSI